MSHDHHDEETLGKPYDARLVRRLMMYVRPYARLVTLAVLMLVAVTCFELAIPYLTRMALDDYIVANSRVVTDDGGEVAREFIAEHAGDLVPIDAPPAGETQSRSGAASGGGRDHAQARYFISAKTLSGYDPREVARATDLGVVGDERYYLADRAFFEARTYDRTGFLEAGSRVGIPLERLDDFTSEDLHELRSGDLRGVARIALAVIALLILTFGFTLLQINMMEVTSQQVMYDMRMKVLRHLQKLSLSHTYRRHHRAPEAQLAAGARQLHRASRHGVDHDRLQRPDPGRLPRGARQDRQDKRVLEREHQRHAGDTDLQARDRELPSICRDQP
jgi:ABC-type multidrug transport system fused ATPase/permease subunit